LPYYCFTEGKIEFGGCVNFMKAGMEYADYITTVSPSYAQEITYPYFGEGLDGYVRYCQHKLVGIINGLDEEAYNPATDKFIPATYTEENVFEQKAVNKENLQKELGLPINRNIPIVAMVSRLVEDKGLSLLTRIMDEMSQENMQFVLLGAGEQDFQNALKSWANRNPKKVSINLRFSEELAHKIYAAADIFIMPSRFEACGLSQLIALKYGTIPVVRETGGLKDTIIPYNKYTGEGNGLTFANFNAHELLFTVKTALSFYEDKTQWNKLVKNAMHSEFSWHTSAMAYKAVYDKVLTAETYAAPAKETKIAKAAEPVIQNVSFEELEEISEETKAAVKTLDTDKDKKAVTKKEVAKKAPAKKAATKTTTKKRAARKSTAKKVAAAAKRAVKKTAAKLTATRKSKKGKAAE
jgi:starch synthase